MFADSWIRQVFILDSTGWFDEDWRSEMSEREEAKEDLAEDLELEESESAEIAGGAGDIKGESADDTHAKWSG
jgi:hypothetical protein